MPIAALAADGDPLLGNAAAHCLLWQAGWAAASDPKRTFPRLKPGGLLMLEGYGPRQLDIIVTNWRESVVQERQAGLMEPLEAGLISWDKIVKLGDIVAGRHPGRVSDDQITYHANNNGTAAADLAIAEWIYRRCKELGRGQELDLPIPGHR